MRFFERLRQLLGTGEANSTAVRGEGDEPDSCGSISCTEALERVQEYLDGELDGPSYAQVARHFQVCQRCYPHLRLEERFREALIRSSAGDVCPERLRHQVLELLASESGGSA
jgi:anti-sigma factor (TIGR02949 family)